MQKQSPRSRICGYYAVASATACCIRDKPMCEMYDEIELMNHFQKVNAEGAPIELFPSVPLQLEYVSEARRRIVYCLCYQPFRGKMIQCLKCQKWYHVKCLKPRPTDEVLRRQSASWYCSCCCNKSPQPGDVQTLSGSEEEKSVAHEQIEEVESEEFLYLYEDYEEDEEEEKEDDEVFQ
jgi:hypothetical protein